MYGLQKYMQIGYVTKAATPYRNNRKCLFFCILQLFNEL